MRNIRSLRIFFAVVLFLAAMGAVGHAVRICVTAPGKTTEFLTQPPDYAQTTADFFDAVCDGDFTGACAHLNGCADLGLQNVPEDEQARMVYAALTDSYGYTVTDVGSRTGMTATQSVSFTALDVAALMDGLGDEINAMLAEKVEQATYARDVYDENGDFRQELVMEMYSAALNDRLERAADYYVTVPLTVRLDCRDMAWYITPNDALLGALSGSPEIQEAAA